MVTLSNDIVMEFAKITKDEEKKPTETIVYGTAKKYNGSMYVKIDGSDMLTPMETTTEIKDGDRVMIMLKNHTATVTGNISSPSASGDTVRDLGNKIGEFDTVIANTVDTVNLVAKKVTANEANIGKLEAKDAEIENLVAGKLDVDTANAKYATIENLTATNAKIDNLDAEKLDAEVADIKFATIENLEAVTGDFRDLEADYANFKVVEIGKLVAKDAEIEKLVADKADIEDLNAFNAEIYNLKAKDVEIENLVADKADIDDLEAEKAKIEKLEATIIDAETGNFKFATIDFANINQAAVEKLFADSGIIKDLVVSDGKITGELVGVTIKGDIIEGGTIIAEKLVVQGSDGLFYKLNTDGVTTTAEQTEYNSLSGTIITAKSVTAEKIAVDDLVAFDATIGGFNITDSAIYSGVKSTVSNTINGVYFDKDGQIAIGDGTKFFKYYKDQNGVYKLEVSADDIRFGSKKESVETVITQMSTAIQSNAEQIELKATKTEVTNQVTTAKSEAISTAATDATNKANTAKSEAISTAATDATNKADTALNDAKSYTDGEIEDVNTNITTNYYSKTQTDAAIKVVSDAVNLKVSTSDFNSYKTEVNGQVSKLETNLNTTNQEISLMKGEIKLKVEQTDINKAINNLDIGGRNLYIIANSVEGYLTANSVDLTAMDSIKQEHTSEFLVVEPGEQYIFQNWVTVDPTDTNNPGLWMAYDFYNSTKTPIGNRPSKTNNTPLANGKCYDIFSISVPFGASYMRVSARFYSDGEVKLERGNKATDWSPAPEDMVTDSTFNDTVESINEAIEENILTVEMKDSIILEAKKEITGWTEEEIESDNGDVVKTLKEVIEDYTSKINVEHDAIQLEITNRTESIENIDNKITPIINNISQHFDFNTDGFSIRQDGSPYEVNIDEDIFVMRESGKDIYWIKEGKVHTPEIEISEQINLLGYILSKDSNGNTNCEWGGD